MCPDDGEWIQTVEQALTEEEFRVWQLRLYVTDAVSFRQIAKELGISKSAAHRRWRKALEKAKKVLEYAVQTDYS